MCVYYSWCGMRRVSLRAIELCGASSSVLLRLLIFMLNAFHSQNPPSMTLRSDRFVLDSAAMGKSATLSSARAKRESLMMFSAEVKVRR